MEKIIHYPYVVRQIPDGWEVLVVNTPSPHRVADFDNWDDAFNHSASLNESWRLEHRAWIQARCAIFRAQERAASQPAEGAVASFAKLLKAGVRLLLRK